MKIVHTKDGRKLYKDELGHWKTAPTTDSMQTYSSVVDLKAKPGEVNEFVSDTEMHEYREDVDREPNKDRQVHASQKEAEIKELETKLADAKLWAGSLDVDQWARKSYRKKVKDLTAELKKLKGK